MTVRTDSTDTYVKDLIELLRPYRQGGLSRHLVLSELLSQRRFKRLPIPDRFEETVQSSFNQHCIDSEVFRSRNAPDEGFFHSRQHGGAATWWVDANRADAWLRTRLPFYELAQAVARLKGVSVEKALNAVERADDDQRRKWRNNLKVKAAIAHIRAEKAARKVSEELELENSRAHNK